MKIVFLLQDTGHIYGAERATIDLVRGLREAGITVSVLLIEETRLALTGSPVREAFLATGVPVQSLATQHRFSRRLAAQIREACVRFGAEVLHSTGYKADLHAWLALRGVSIAMVSTVHGWLNRPDVKERFYAWLNLRAFGRFDRVIVLTKYYENFLRARGIQRLERIPTGIDPITAPPPRAADRPFTFGILGRLSSEKNHALFVEAAELVLEQRRNVRFLIAGDGPLRSNVAESIASRGLSEAVAMAGYVSTDAFFGQVDVLVLCSRIENLPMVVLEAMARGCPVIATDVGGLRDLVEDGRTGRLVASGDVGALAAAMQELADSPAKGEAWGGAGRGKLVQEFSRSGWIAKHVDLYGSVSRARGREFQRLEPGPT